METVKHKSFGKFFVLWTGEFVSSIGSGLTAFALGVYVYQTTHAATSVALVTLCSFLPIVLLSPVGGVLADRFDRRLMMILGDLCSAFGLVFILVIMLIGTPELWQICLGVTISSVFVSLLEPAYKATITDLLTEEQFASASGLVQLAASSKYLLSPVIAGFLLGITDIKAILLIDISTFFVTAFTIMAVKRNLRSVQEKRGRQRFLKELKEGWDAIADARGVLLLVIIISVVTFYIGFLQTLFTPMVLSFSDAKTLGALESVSAVGMLLGSLFIGVFGVGGKYANVLAAGLGFAGLFFSMIGLTANIYFIAGAGFLFFTALPFINTSADVLIRKNIDNERQGRAWGLIGVISQLGYVVAYAFAGVLADYVFNPLLSEGGVLASSVGQVIGTGQGRGIGFLFVISGAFVAVFALVVSRVRSIRALEGPLQDPGKKEGRADAVKNIEERFL